MTQATKTTQKPTALYAVTGYQRDGKTWNLGTQLSKADAMTKMKKTLNNPIFKAVAVREMEQ